MNKVRVNGNNEFEVDGNIVNGNILIADILKIDDRFYHILKDNRSYNIEIINSDRAAKSFTLKINGSTYKVEVKDKFDLLLQRMGLNASTQTEVKELKAPMPGMVTDIRVSVGQKINKGDAMIVLEAMKMENMLKAPTDGIIKSIEVIKGKSVEKNQVMIVFE